MPGDRMIFGCRELSGGLSRSEICASRSSLLPLQLLAAPGLSPPPEPVHKGHQQQDLLFFLGKETMYFTFLAMALILCVEILKAACHYFLKKKNIIGTHQSSLPTMPARKACAGLENAF